MFEFNTETGLAMLAAYLVGSIPFGLLLTKAAGLGDVRAQGSGNIGATNVLRAGGKKLGAATLLLDLLKGLAGVLIARFAFGEDTVPYAAVAAVLGHCFPVWLGFRGGKGVATNAGVAFGLAWMLGAVYAIAWLGVLAVTRISSLAGMTAVVVTAVAAWFAGETEAFIALAVIAALVLWLHRANIGRLLKGEEPKVGSKT
ncbi:glycerol-3-phosphate 1-O-acyltransferase PlsY [Blastomonas marina]|uniref:glycerol-3-phosphate 1-O-acyltransferase PlsY n=1 Tax=Blastomonas marina TaxID=1867408 RepID=UPI002AC9A2C6|nr:glycerol-3-phosphate 1-O-acyltransferase PlsY [Blastomonas marina]WPZ04902.1 glycerol-3-phosphate 1-O-acyltransferase PlsY [Blastomonas marina]